MDSLAFVGQHNFRSRDVLRLTVRRINTARRNACLSGCSRVRPARPDVSIDPVSDRNLLPMVSIRSRMTNKSFSERGSRSSFHTTRVELQSRKPKYGLGRHHTDAAVGHVR
jgi:hypothetical protein